METAHHSLQRDGLDICDDPLSVADQLSQTQAVVCCMKELLTADREVPGHE